MSGASWPYGRNSNEGEPIPWPAQIHATQQEGAGNLGSLPGESEGIPLRLKTFQGGRVGKPTYAVNPNHTTTAQGRYATCKAVLTVIIQ